VLAAAPRRDDTALLQGMIDRGEPIVAGVYWISRPLQLRGPGAIIRNNVIHGPSQAIVLQKSKRPHIVTNNVFVP
jgi:hypothetical protein